MRNIRSRSLFICSLVFILIFAFAAAAQNKKPVKPKKAPPKDAASKTAKTPPKLKAGVLTSAKTSVKEKTAAVKAPLKDESDHSTAVETEPQTQAIDPAPKKVLHPAARAGKENSAAAATATPKVTKVRSKKKIPPPAIAKTQTKAVNTAPQKVWQPAARVDKKSAPVASVASAAKSEPQVKAVSSPPQKVWLPAISSGKVKTDINGKTVPDVPSEEAGDGMMDWQFANSQAKEIEILKTNRNGNELVVEARLAAKKARANLDGSFDRVRGVARLFYERSGSRWQLTRIENISLRHSDTASDNPIYPAYTIPPAPPVSTAVSIVPGGSTVPVAAGKFQSYSFRVADRAVVTGRFQAKGGAGNDIEAYILDYDGFVNWSNNHSAPAYYNSGRLTVGTIKTTLSAGTYYLVFNNRYSPADAKTVEVSVEMKTDNSDETGRAYDPYGRGLTVNTISRVYAPSANPAPSYVPLPVSRDSNAAAYTIEPARPLDQAPIKSSVSRIGGYTSEQILSDTFEVKNGGFQAFPFTVKPGGLVQGTFRVVSGNEGNIEAFIMTAREYDKWSSYREGVVDYSSGRVTSGGIHRLLSPGNYYLVFSNYYSVRENRTVAAEIYIEYLPEQ